MTEQAAKVTVEQGWILEKVKPGYLDPFIQVGDRGIVRKGHESPAETETEHMSFRNTLPPPVVEIYRMVPNDYYQGYNLHNGSPLQQALDEGVFERVECTLEDLNRYRDERREHFFAFKDKHPLFDGTLDLSRPEDLAKFDEKMLTIVQELPGFTTTLITTWFAKFNGDEEYRMAWGGVHQSCERLKAAGSVSLTTARFSQSVRKTKP